MGIFTPNIPVAHLGRFIGFRRKKSLPPTLEELETAQRARDAWKDLLEKVSLLRRACSKLGWNDNFSSSLIRLKVRLDDYHTYCGRLPTNVRKDLDLDLLFTVEFLSAIQRVRLDTCSFKDRLEWSMVITETVERLKHSQTRGVRGRSYGNPPRHYSDAPALISAEKHPDTAAGRLLYGDRGDIWISHKGLRSSLAQWRSTLEAWQAQQESITPASSRTRGIHLIREIEASIMDMANSSDLRRSTAAQERLRDSIDMVQHYLHRTLEGASPKSEAAFLSNLNALDQQVPR